VCVCVCVCVCVQYLALDGNKSEEEAHVSKDLSTKDSLVVSLVAIVLRVELLPTPRPLQ
jgi:hypothetical protein